MGSGTTETVISLAWSADLADLGGHLMGDFGLDVRDEVGLGLVHGVAGDLLKHFELALFDELYLLLLGLGLSDLLIQSLGLFLKRIGLAVEGLLLLLEPALLFGELGAAFLDLALVLTAALVYLFPRLHKRFALFRLSGLDRLVYDPLCLFFSAGDLTLGDLFAVADAQKKAYYQRSYAGNAGYYPFHSFSIRLPFNKYCQ